MRSVLVIAPSRLDLDIEAHLGLLMRSSALRVRRFRIGDDSSLMLGRVAAATASARRATTLLTVGQTAIQASALFRGRHFHLLGPGASKTELKLARLLSPSSVVAANQVVHQQIRDSFVIFPPRATGSISPRQTRKLLGVRDDEKLVFVPTMPSRTSGHRMALWVVGILRFLDERWRVVTLSRDAGVLYDFAAHTGQPRLLVSHSSLDALSIAGASDLALLAPCGRFDLQPVASCAARGLPIVAPDRPMLRAIASQAGIRLVDDPKPRRLALALLDAPEPIPPEQAWLDRFTEAFAERAWLDLIAQRRPCPPLMPALSETA